MGGAGQFQSTRSVRSATARPYTPRLHPAQFQSTRSVRSATNTETARFIGAWISIHALRAERDRTPPVPSYAPWIFQSTRSVRSATVVEWVIAYFTMQFQSTRSVRSATLAGSSASPARFFISIHALRAERDKQCAARVCFGEVISIHALRAERDVNGAGLAPHRN